jgi:hypothetical protein
MEAGEERHLVGAPPFHSGGVCAAAKGTMPARAIKLARTNGILEHRAPISFRIQRLSTEQRTRGLRAVRSALKLFVSGPIDYR